jgi:hypothetical protein
MARAYPSERLTSCGQVFSWTHRLLPPLGHPSCRARGGMDGATAGKPMPRPPRPRAPHDDHRHLMTATGTSWGHRHLMTASGTSPPASPVSCGRAEATCSGDVLRRVVRAELVLLALTVIGCGRYPCSSVHAYRHARGTRSAGLVTRQRMRDSLALDDHPGAGPRIRSHMKAYDCAHFQPQGR